MVTLGRLGTTLTEVLQLLIRNLQKANAFVQKIKYQFKKEILYCSILVYKNKYFKFQDHSSYSSREIEKTLGESQISLKTDNITGNLPRLLLCNTLCLNPYILIAQGPMEYIMRGWMGDDHALSTNSIWQFNWQCFQSARHGSN